jgi:hypothetical protein
MTTGWKPVGHPSLSPYIMFTRAQQVIDFLKQVFGGTELRRFDQPDGTVGHARFGGVKGPAGNTWWISSHVG